MLSEYKIRPASVADATAICDVVRSSIEQLCFPDHKGNPSTLALWLANKTPDNVLRWLGNSQNILLVAVDGSTLVGAGCVALSGEVVLNYVSPLARLRGISSAILKNLESAAKQAGNVRCTLDSTLTAHDFYRGRGYVDVESVGEKFGMKTFPMVKLL